MWKRVAFVAAVLALTGCPYTEGCEHGLLAPVGDGGTGPSPTTSTDGSAPDAEVVLAPLGGPAEPACAGITSTCAGGASCCATADVPGGSFNRSNDARFPATVSSFRLDKFEVTVGRFRAFVKAGMGTRKSPPAEGAGANPNVPGSGWTAKLTEGLHPDEAALRAAIACDVLYPAWTEQPGPKDDLPMNCVSWYEAQAFCIWDGGRLPTEAEWNYAGAGGDEQRKFAWGSDSLDLAHATWGCKADGVGGQQCSFDTYYLPIGSKSPLGDARWGHSDMTGSQWEWTADWLAEPEYQIIPCNDCAELTPHPKPGDVERRAFRGGAFNWDDLYQPTSYRGGDPPDARYGSIGFRCARPIP